MLSRQALNPRGHLTHRAECRFGLGCGKSGSNSASREISSRPKRLSFHTNCYARSQAKRLFPKNQMLTWKNGWGGWIRTNVWRDQNPLPYHLATPQHEKTTPNQTSAALNCACRGETFKPRATKVRQRSGTRAATRSASIALANAAKMQDPVPVRRAGAKFPSQLNASATSGKRARTTGSQSFRVASAAPGPKAARIVMMGEFRVNSGLWNTSRVGTETPGWTTTYQRSGSSTGSRRSPTPSAQAEEPRMKTGTSAPSGRPRRASSSIDRPQPHK